MSDANEAPKDGTIFEFLLGSAPYKGLWFGESPPDSGRFWWRTDLRAALQAQASAEPVAWVESRTIDDRDGRPIGMDEPLVHWGAERPDDLDCQPLYSAPPPLAEAKAKLAEAMELLTEVVRRYDDYRGKAVMPAPGEYQMIVGAIEHIRAYLESKL